MITTAPFSIDHYNGVQTMDPRTRRNRGPIRAPRISHSPKQHSLPSTRPSNTYSYLRVPGSNQNNRSLIRSISPMLLPRLIIVGRLLFHHPFGVKLETFWEVSDQLEHLFVEVSSPTILIQGANNSCDWPNIPIHHPTINPLPLTLPGVLDT